MTAKKKGTAKGRARKVSTAAADSTPRQPVDYFTHTDQGNVDRFIAAFGNGLRFDHLRGQWYGWKKHYWEPILDSVVLRNAAALIKKRHGDAKTANQNELADWLHFCQSGNHIREMVSRARYERPIAVESDIWNKDPLLFAVENGVIDLRTGELRDGKRADYITLHSPVKFDPAATCPRYDQFHSEIFKGREDLMRYVDRAQGYSLTGFTRERCLFICWGSGNNGKGALFDIMEYVLGGYASVTPASTLAPSRNEHAPRNDLARLVSSRMVVAQETDLKGGVAEALLKNITGKDTITCRFLHKEFFQYKPEFTFWLSCNNRPPIQGTDDAIWRRLPLIPFDAVFTGDREQKDLDAALRLEAPGILNRFVANCLAWQREGLGEQPECVKVASEQYRIASNPVIAYLDAYCDRVPAPVPGDCKEGTEPTKLWESYADYMRRLHRTPVDQPTFKACMEALGYVQKRSKTRRYWQGVALQTENVADFEVELD